MACAAVRDGVLPDLPHVLSLICRERKTGGIKLVKKKPRRRHTDVSARDLNKGSFLVNPQPVLSRPIAL